MSEKKHKRAGVTGERGYSCWPPGCVDGALWRIWARWVFYWSFLGGCDGH